MNKCGKKPGGVQLFQRTCPKTDKNLLTTTPNSPYIIWNRGEYYQDLE